VHKEIVVTGLNGMDIGYCELIQQGIDTGDHFPIKQSHRCPSLSARQAEDDMLDEMLESGVTELSDSPWASPVCLVKKKDGTFRFCVDYRGVNAVSKRDAFPIPDINDALDHLRGSRYFAKIDLFSGYWKLGMTNRAMERSASCTRRGLFQFTRMPFGVAGVGLKGKPSKCALFKRDIELLGPLVTFTGVDSVPDKLKAIRDMRAFVGLVSYYRWLVRNFASIAESLTRLTKKNTPSIWTDEADIAFTHLKQALLESATLAFPVPGLPCILDTDASDVAIGAVLSQVLMTSNDPSFLGSTP